MPPLRRPQFRFLACFLLPLAEETGEKQTTHALTAQQATGDQLTDDLFLVSAAFLSATNSFLLAK